MTCKQCGECCRYVILRMFGVSGPWLDYWTTRGGKFLYRMRDGSHDTTTIYRGKEGLEGLLMYSPCPHLKIDDKSPTVLNKDGYFLSIYRCDIYDRRPQLCKCSADREHWVPEGCTNEK